MELYKIKSRKYVPVSSKMRIISVIINIAVVIISINSIISIISNGISISNVSSVIIAIAFSAFIKKGDLFSPHYEFCYASISFESEYFDIEYLFEKESKREKYRFYYNEINTIEYSDILKCIRVCGKYTLFGHIEKTKSVFGEWLIYIDDSERDIIINKLSRYIGKQVVFKDRESK